MELPILIIIIWNVVIVLFYGIDKYRSRKKLWRISEKMLILPAFLLGSIGAMFGMILFNHKTSKMKFRLLIPLAFVLHVVLVYFAKYLPNLV
jgi:uncharacterized membrane protein YsdA (DUF1294 family)